MEIELSKVVQEVIEMHARAIVSELLGKDARWAMDNELREVVKQRALQLLKEKELDQMLREALAKWINNPVSR